MIRKVKKGQKVFSQNDKSREMYYIESGEIRIQQHKSGENLDLATLSKGSLFGEMALIDGKPRSASAIALSDSELVVVTEEDFKARVQNVPGWYLALIRVTSERLRRANQRVQTSHQLKMISNVADLLVILLKTAQIKEQDEEAENSEPSADIKYVKRELLNILGIGRHQMTEALSFLEQKNMILMFSNRLSVADLDELRQYAVYLKTYDPEEEIELMDENFMQYCKNLKKILDTAFKKMDIVTFSLANFKTELKENMELPENMIEWFLAEIKKIKVVTFMGPDGKKLKNIKNLEANGQLRFDSKYLGEVLQMENFKRMGV